MGYRKKCLSEKGRCCVECGADENIEVHHIDRDRGNNSIENLVPMCYGCHMDVHSSTGGLGRWRKQLKDETSGTSLAIKLDDEQYERARAVKQDLGVTWAEFIGHAADELDETE